MRLTFNNHIYTVVFLTYIRTSQAIEININAFKVVETIALIMYILFNYYFIMLQHKVSGVITEIKCKENNKILKSHNKILTRLFKLNLLSF